MQGLCSTHDIQLDLQITLAYGLGSLPDLCSDQTGEQTTREESRHRHRRLPCHIKSHTLLTEVARPVPLAAKAPRKVASPETTEREYLFVRSVRSRFVFHTACVTKLNLFLHNAIFMKTPSDLTRAEKEHQVLTGIGDYIFLCRLINKAIKVKTASTAKTEVRLERQFVK